MLFNEPKLLKFVAASTELISDAPRFSALQRAEIAEIFILKRQCTRQYSFSALQRAEIAEMTNVRQIVGFQVCFSALQRAEIAEINCR